MAITKNQHHVFRHYLESWKIPNKSRKENKNIFSTNPKNVGVERYFYRFPILSDNDMKVAKYIGSVLTSKSMNKELEQLVKQIFNFYNGRRAFVDAVEASKHFRQWFKNNIGTNDEYEALTNSNDKCTADYIYEGLESRYCHAENAGAYGLAKVQSGDLSFWEDTDERNKFCYFLCNQYFRTKSMRDKLSRCLRDKILDLKKHGIVDSLYKPNMNGISQIICDYMEAYLFCSDELFTKTPILLSNTTRTPFITSDNPIVNISECDDKGNPVDFILYFPVTPSSALLLVDGSNNHNSTFSVEDVNHYNLRIFDLAYKQVYANEHDVLENIMQTSRF